VKAGWRQQLPAHAPLRTVLESFPSHGSSRHKVSLIGLTRGLTGETTPLVHKTTWQYSEAAMIRACSLRPALRDASTDERRSSFAFPVGIGSTYFLAISDQTDVGISGALHAGIGFFGPPNAAPPDPPCGEVCPVSRARLAAFPRSAIFTPDDLGSLFTPAVPMFASGHRKGPEPDCLPFGPSLEQSLVA
jgi:hypothetical protein